MAGVTWRVGGLKSASGRLSWNPQKAFTGFWKGTRKFEEPNPFSTLDEHLFASGYRAYVDADSSFVTDHRALIDVVMFSSVLHSPIYVVWIPLAGSGNKIYWAFINPSSRVTPRETWIVNSNLPISIDED